MSMCQSACCSSSPHCTFIESNTRSSTNASIRLERLCWLSDWRRSPWASLCQEWGWLSAGMLAALAISLVMLVVGVYVEAHVEHPILNLGLVTNRVFAFANISFMLCM